MIISIFREVRHDILKKQEQETIKRNHLENETEIKYMMSEMKNL